MEGSTPGRRTEEGFRAMDEERVDRHSDEGLWIVDPDCSASRLRRLGTRIADLRHLGWDIGVRGMVRLTGQHRGDRLDFRLRASARDLLADKGRAVRDEMESLAQAVQRAGSYPAREEATRAFHAAMDALREQVPADVLLKLSEHLPEVEAKRLRAALRQQHH